jgi:hypothetical protein
MIQHTIGCCGAAALCALIGLARIKRGLIEALAACWCSAVRGVSTIWAVDRQRLISLIGIFS